MIIKEFSDEHLDAVCDIEQSSFTHPWHRKLFESEILKENAYMYVCIEDNEVIGFAILNTILDEGELLHIAVSTAHRRKGVAKALFDKLFQIANEKELSFITLEVRESNQSAIALYEYMGFERVGVRKNYYSKPTENAVLMTKYF